MQRYGLPASTGAAHRNIYSLLFPRRLHDVQRTGIFSCETVGNVSVLRTFCGAWGCFCYKYYAAPQLGGDWMGYQLQISGVAAVISFIFINLEKDGWFVVLIRKSIGVEKSTVYEIPLPKLFTGIC